MNLVERAGLWTDERRTATREAERRIQAGEMSVVRLAFADQHGVLRGKTFAASEIDAALKNGVGFSATMLLKDTAHRTVFPVWQPGAGFYHPDQWEWDGTAQTWTERQLTTMPSPRYGASVVNPPMARRRRITDLFDF